MQRHTRDAIDRNLIGHLTVVQDELAAAVSVPVIISSLFLIPLVRRMVSGRPIGVVTAHSDQLSRAYLSACGVDPAWAVHVRGMETGPSFNGAILGGTDGEPPELNVDGASAEVATLCATLQAQVPDLAAFVFECTNLQPYAALAKARTRLPVFGIYHLITMLDTAARAPRFYRAL